ncbi:hypothetical protein NDU88_003248 [Pleurodeles waltl]|uniref:Uncharacterized protein n=1 Tax=Pleurodeles waltl TaxID=8319 RepID=A0AAV7SG77_PLEWA|nr:hypothetical protein NDU88_003248 [Pleurodeles waltl]
MSGPDWPAFIKGTNQHAPERANGVEVQPGHLAAPYHGIRRRVDVLRDRVGELLTCFRLATSRGLELLLGREEHCKSRPCLPVPEKSKLAALDDHMARSVASSWVLHGWINTARQELLWEQGWKVAKNRSTLKIATRQDIMPGNKAPSTHAVGAGREWRKPGRYQSDEEEEDVLKRPANGTTEVQDKYEGRSLTTICRSWSSQQGTWQPATATNG